MSYFKLLRPKQWSKNLLVFAGPIFAEKMREPEAVKLTFLAFAAMCCLSSATYILNDILDAPADRKHPEKASRPIASGAVSVGAAIAIAIILAGICAAIALGFNTSSQTLLAFYAFIQIAYNLKLKQLPIADVFTIALGFLIRAMLGAAVVSVFISGWLLYCTGALALMLGFAKRRHEFVLQGENRAESRQSLDGYSMPALDALVIMTATGAAMCYGIYTVNSSTAEKYPAIIITSLFVFYGIARYVQLTFSRNEGGEPADLLFKDPHLLASVVLFLATAVWAVSGLKIPLLEK